MPAWFSTARFTFFDFPLPKIFRLLGFLQRDLHFLISRCQRSSVYSVFYSGICNFLFSAVANILLARFSTAGFTFLSFPLSKFLCLPSFQQRDLHFLIFRCFKHSSCPIFNGGICISQFSAVYGIFAEKEDLNNLRFLKQPSPDNPEFCERKPLDKRRFELFYHEQHKCKKGDIFCSLAIILLPRTFFEITQ